MSEIQMSEIQTSEIQISEICTSGQNKSLYPRHKSIARYRLKRETDSGLGPPRHKGIAKYRLKVGAPDKKTTPNGVVF